MTGFEILLGYLSNLQVLFAVVAITASVLAAGYLFVWLVIVTDDCAPDGETAVKIRKAAPKLAIVLIVSWALAAVPTIDDLWKVRLGLLKLELASPANVEKAGDHLEVIVKGLECKYLKENCPKKEESK